MEQKSNLQENELYQKGIQAFKKNNYAYAIELFRIVLKTYPESTQCLHYLMSSARENQKLHKLSILKLVFSKINMLILSAKTICFYLQNKIDIAIELQEELILLNPSKISSLYKLATFFNRINKNANAIAILEEILLIDKNNLASLKFLCRLYFQNKNYAKAKTIAKMTLDISPKDLEAENIINDISALNTIEKGFDEIKPAT